MLRRMVRNFVDEYSIFDVGFDLINLRYKYYYCWYKRNYLCWHHKSQTKSKRRRKSTSTSSTSRMSLKSSLNSSNTMNRGAKSIFRHLSKKPHAKIEYPRHQNLSKSSVPFLKTIKINLLPCSKLNLFELLVELLLLQLCANHTDVHTLPPLETSVSTALEDLTLILNIQHNHILVMNPLPWELLELAIIHTFKHETELSN